MVAAAAAVAAAAVVGVAGVAGAAVVVEPLGALVQRPNPQNKRLSERKKPRYGAYFYCNCYFRVEG